MATKQSSCRSREKTNARPQKLAASKDVIRNAEFGSQVAERFGRYRPNLAFELISHSIPGPYRPKVVLSDFEIIARCPLGASPQPVLIIVGKGRSRTVQAGMTNLEESDCRFLGDAMGNYDPALIRAAFASLSKTGKHIVSLGSDAYPTLRYLCSGGKLKGKSPEIKPIDGRILEHWPEWQRRNLSMKARADVLEGYGFNINAERLRSRCLRLGLIANIRKRRQRSS